MDRTKEKPPTVSETAGEHARENTKENGLETPFSDTNIIPQRNQNVKSFRCNIDTVGYKTKDEAKKKTGAIVNRTKTEKQIIITTAELLAEAVTKGFSFTTAALKGTKEADFVSQQLLIVDIDNEAEGIPETTIEDAIHLLTDHHIDFSFIYYSFSHSTIRPKFRIVCVLDKPITDPAEAKRLNQYFISLFPQADKSCFNLDRFYYGTDKGLATTVHNRTTTITVPLGWTPEQSEPEKTAPKEGDAPPISEDEAKTNSEKSQKNENEASAKQAEKDKNGGNFNIGQAIRDFNLREYIERTTGTTGTRSGKEVKFKGKCPLCGHQDDFCINTEKNLYFCHSSSNHTGGNIITYLIQKHGFTLEKARDYFKYDILKRDRQADKNEYKRAKSEEKQKAKSQTEDYIDLSAISTWGELISDKILNYVFYENDSVIKTRNIAILNDKAKSFRKLNDFKKISKAFADRVAREKRAEFLKNNPNGLDFTDCPILLKSDTYRGTDEGIFFYDECVTPQPLVITRRFENAESGIMTVELAFKHQNKWKYHVTSAETIANRNKIVSLADNGLMVTTANAAEIVQYLLFLQTENADIIPIFRNVSRLGHMNGEFIPYSSDYIYGGEPSYLPIYNSIHNKGEAVEWINLIREVRGDSVTARTVIAATFASPLLNLLNLPCFFVHPWGNTGSGKTVSLLLAASAWGNPHEYLRNFNSTGVALERTAHFFHHMPFIIDEIQTVRSKHRSENISFSDMIYNLTQGMGRSRGTIHGVEKTLTWRCIIITNGEQPLTSERSSTGEFNRVLELYDTEILKNPSHVYNVVNDNYGYAGQKFINELNGHDIESIADRWAAWIKNLNTAASGKQQMIMKALLVADELINRILLEMPETEAQRSTAEYWGELSTQFADIKENDVIKRAYEYTIGWIAENRDKFHTLKNIAEEDATQELYSQWGKFSKNSKTIFISGNALKDALSKSGFNYESTIKGFNERDYVVNDTSSDKHKKSTKKIRLNGILTRGIEIKTDIEI